MTKTINDWHDLLEAVGFEENEDQIDLWVEEHRLPDGKIDWPTIENKIRTIPDGELLGYILGLTD